MLLIYFLRYESEEKGVAVSFEPPRGYSGFQVTGMIKGFFGFERLEFRILWIGNFEAGTKVGPDQLGPPVRVGSTRIDSDQLGSNKIIKIK